VEQMTTMTKHRWWWWWG